MSDYLLDVNVLIAHAILEHEHHQTVTDRLQQLADGDCHFHVCPIVELGLVRNVMRIGSLPIHDARQLLENEHTNLGLEVFLYTGYKINPSICQLEVTRSKRPFSQAR